MATIKNNHTIEETKTKGVFKVMNNENKKRYTTDINFPAYCSCEDFQFRKKKEKKLCKHIKICKSIREIKV